MRTNKFKRKIFEYISNGWDVHETQMNSFRSSFRYAVTSPSGNIFVDRDIRGDNTCALCCANTTEDWVGCDGGHSDEDLDELENAHRIYELVDEGRYRFNIFRYIKNISK